MPWPIDKVARATPGVAHTVAFAGMSFLLQAPSPTMRRYPSSPSFAKRQSPH